MKPKILVVGDAMYDKYYIGTTTRISPEAPIPVVKVVETKFFGGGCLNVDRNLRDLGAETRVVHGWNCSPGTRAEVPQKNRLVVGTQQIARWDEYDEVSSIDLERLDEAILHWEPTAIVVSDYGKGSINYDVRNWIYSKGKQVFVDSKSNPEEWSWHGVTLFPNQHEYEQFKFDYDYRPSVVLKRSEKGIQRLEQGKVVEEYPAWASHVVSVCGAGDTVLAAYAYAYCVGLPPLPFSNAAAAVVVSKPWTSTATSEEIFKVVEEVKQCQATSKG
jgi:bifunctional ADP-heptose synthase (sugar kinase/adenylyltransferase)